VRKTNDQSIFLFRKSMYFYGNIQNIKYEKFMERVRIITSQNLGLISLGNKVASILILGTLTF